MARILKNAIHDLGARIAGAVDLLAPDMVVPGGGLEKEMESPFVAGVTETVTKVASGNSPATCRSFPQGWEIGREYQVREPLLNRQL